MESLRVLKEKAIRQESQALVLYGMYEANQYYTADPLLEQWSEEWREQFAYLETGSVYVARAARQLARTEKEYFPAWPFWTISLICREAEADRLWERLTKKAGEMTQPVFILTQEEARGMLDRALAYPAPIPEAGRRVIPNNWELNLSMENFQSWKRDLEQKAGEAGKERRKQEQALQLNMELFNRLKAFLEKYPHEETQQLKENLRQTREQIFAWEQRIKESEARLQDIDLRLNLLNKNITDIIEENTDLSHRIMKAQDYLKKADEGDKARLAVRQYSELLQTRQEQMDRDLQQRDRKAGNLQEVEKDLLVLQEELRHLRREALYQEVKDAAPLETVLTRPRLETERQGLLDALHKKQKGRQSLEENLSHTRHARTNAEKELNRKRRQCDTQINEEMVFPPGGEDEIELLIEQDRHLKKELGRLQPDKEKLTKEEAIARDRFTQQQDEFLRKYRERVIFTQPLPMVEAELRQESEQIESRQRYLEEQMQKLTAEEELLHQAMEEMERKNERYDYLQEDIPGVDLPSATEQDFAYQPMKIITGYLEAIQQNQLQLNQSKEGLEEEKTRLEAFCQEEVRDIKLQRMVTSGLKYRDNFTEVLEWKQRLSSRIAFAIRSAEDDLREHDRELQEFINRLHSYLVTIKTELRIIPRKTRVKVDDNWKEIFQFDLPEWDEKEGKDELRRHVDWMISQIESSRYRDENGNEDYPLMHKDIEKWLQPQQLLRNVMKEKNIRVRCRKVTADGKVSSHPISWEGSNQWSGGEKWSKNMALFLGIQNYLAEKREAVNSGVKRSRAVVLDNPFGKASSDHVLDPVFFIAGQLGFQIIALTALAEGKFVREYFPIVYSCRLRPSTNPDKYLMVTDQEIRHAYFQDHDPEALRRLGEHKQIELF